MQSLVVSSATVSSTTGDLPAKPARSKPSTAGSRPANGQSHHRARAKDKERSEGIEFDGTTVLCRVCGDKASGFHYGVHSCEGCKGFFRRSIQQKIQYRPCTKNQQCSILRINRNRCQYCRLKKCIAVGMSRDAVRFGRVPKREKAKILAAMQSVNARSQERALTAELEDESRLIATIVQAHEQTCDYTQEKVAPLLQRAHDDPIYTQCPPTLACPLNPNPQPLQNGNQRILEDFSERFSPAIRGVVEFAKRIPGFSLLSQDDQVTLLKAGVFEVLLVRLACMFDSQSNLMLCLNGQVLKRESLQNTSNARFLMDSMFDFAERLNVLRLRDGELGLFCAVVIIAADRPGLRNAELVEKMQSKMMQALQTVVMQSHPEMPGLFQELLKKIPDLRTLNTLHSEKLLAFKMEPHHQDTPSLSALSASAINSYIAPQQPGSWGSNEYAVAAGLVPGDDSKGSWEERELIQSPGQRSSSSAGSEWSLAESKETDDYCSPPYTVDSKGDSESVCSSEVAQITELQSSKRRREHSHSEGVSSGDEGSVVDSPSRCPFKLRKLESPSDSGIESGKELASNGSQSTGTSMCGSPRSLVEEKVKEVDCYEGEKGDPTDDMPVLKRALQAPPLINTNLLMDEAYKPHKKFRALRKEADLPSSAASDVSATGSMSSFSSTTSSPSLASTHSVLVRSLEQGPRMTEQQLKRTDIIHNIIMRNESHARHEAMIAATTTSSSVMVNGGSNSGGQVLYGMPQLATPSFFAPNQPSTVSASAACPKNVMVCAPPGYYIPQQQQNSVTSAAQYQNNNWPFISPAVSNAGLAVQVRPSATYVPNVQPLTAVQHQNLPPQLSPQPHQQRMASMVSTPTATSPQPANVPPASPSSTSATQLPRMYYDPRSTTPTSAAVSPAVPCSTSFQCYSNGVAGGNTNSKQSSPKPTSPLSGQVMELLRVDVVGENQPLNLSKKVASPPPTPTHTESAHFHKVKLEGV